MRFQLSQVADQLRLAGQRGRVLRFSRFSFITGLAHYDVQLDDGRELPDVPRWLIERDSND